MSISQQKRTAQVKPSSPNANLDPAKAQQQQNRTQQQNKQAQQGIKKLGTIKSLPQASQVVGNVVDVLVPQVGEKSSINLNLNIPIHPSGSIKLSFSVSGQVERVQSNQVKMRTEVQLGLLGEIKVNALFVELQAHLRAAGLGYIETVGSNGAEAFNFIGLLVRQTIAKKSEKVASYLMDGATRDSLFKGMGKGEYAEGGFGFDVSAGVGVRSGSEKADASAGYRKTVGTRYTSDQNSKNYRQSTIKSQEFRLSASYNARPSVNLSGSLKFNQEGSKQSIQAGVEGDAKMSAAQLDAIFISSTWLSGLASTFAGIVTQGSKSFQGSGLQKASALAGMIRKVNPATAVQNHYTAGALKRLSNFNGLNIGHKISINAGIDNGKPKGSITLERYSEVEYGNSPRSTVHLLLQNIDPVLSIPLF